MTKDTDNGAVKQGTYSGAIVAKVLNVSERRLRQLAAEGVIPRTGRDRYPLVGAAHAYITFLQRTSIGGPANVQPDELEPFRRKAHYQAESEKLRIAERAGQLLQRADVEAAMAATAKIVSRFFDTLPDILERDTAATPAQLARLETLLDAVREEMYSEIIRDPADDTNGAAAHS